MSSDNADFAFSGKDIVDFISGNTRKKIKNNLEFGLVGQQKPSIS